MQVRPPSEKWFRVAFWAALIFAFVMALLPNPPQVPSGGDKAQHMIAFTVLTVLATHAYVRTSHLKTAMGLFLIGALIEALQSIPALNRSASFYDLAADWAAVTLVLLVVRFRRWP